MSACGRILIAGCGYLGLGLSRYLSQRGSEVWGLRRSRSAEAEIKSAGAKPIFADLTGLNSLQNLPDIDGAVCAQAPGRDGLSYEQTYLSGARNLIRALWANPPQKFLWISSTSVYGDFSGAWVDEKTPPRPEHKNAEVLLEAERVVLGAEMPSLILRLGGIYGPGRTRLSLLENGAVSAHDSGYLNHIHVVDAVRLAAFLLEKGKPGEIYLGVDDEPVLRSVFYEWLAERGGIRLPVASAHDAQKGMRSLTSKRCRNRKVKALGFRLKYPTYREGFAKLLP